VPVSVRMPRLLLLLVLQHGPPALPHGAHTEVLDPVELVVHARSKLAQPVPVGRVPLAQQGSPVLPQVHRPDLHVP